MPGNILATETTSWFENKENSSGPRVPAQHALTATYSIDPNQSLTVCLIEALVDTLQPPNGQTSLSLYTYVNPDALEKLLEASETKESGVEVRFTIDDYLVTVRSNNTILIYEPLNAHRSTGGRSSFA
jgi:hypothetical protein